MARAEPYFDDSADPPVRGHLHRPESTSGDGLALTHGAGSDSGAPLLVAVAEALAAAGMTVLRYDLPYRQARAKGPPRPGDAARDREGIRRVAAVMRGMASGRLLLGGHSYGGRQTSMVAAEDPSLGDALLLQSYPLHPPGRPEQLRTAHLPNLRMRAFFVQGTRDNFGTPEEMQAALELIPAETQLYLVRDAGHDLGFGRKHGVDVVAMVQEFLKFLG
ncbi:MAG TPA: alpha/beta family hydrolase [Terriglobales bacterium]|nr:alpha/beta family hydrolase [Terriglobales bacterium]